MKKTIVVGFLVLILLAIIIFAGYGGHDMQPEKALKELSKIINSGDLQDLSLTIYYVNPYALTPIPWKVDDLIRACQGQEIVVNGNDLDEYIDLLDQLANVSLIPVQSKASFLDVRIYYKFETGKKGKLFDVAMWSSGGIIINGLEFEKADIFYDVILPFLSEDDAKTLEKGLGRENQEG